jgi:23S rRNA (cytosine1962-C5)-methyltransferase
VNAEGDGLPGLVVDRYADVVVVKLSSAGMASRRDELVSALRHETGAAAGYERADVTATRREGLSVVKGALWGESPPGSVPIAERNRRFAVDVVGGQKTGFYIDQRDARDLVTRLAAGGRVLDLFGYTGGFAVAAALGGAREVTLVESSASALERARTHLYVNAPSCPAELHAADAFGFLRGSEPAEPYDLLVIDPPPLARRRGDVTRATRAYKDLLLHALRRAAPGAHILAFACSHHVGPDLFRKVVFGAALDAGRSPRVLRELGAPSDHPVSIDHPEGRYLTGLLLGVDRD